MNFNPCMKHKLVRKTVRDFAESEIGPVTQAIDREARFPWEIIERMRPLGYFGLQTPTEFGGAGMDSISYAIVIEELSRVCAAVGLCVTVHNSVGLAPILDFGSQDQIRRYVPRLASGEFIGAFCITEANAGSDAGGVETSAVAHDGGYIINGTKIFVTNGAICHCPLVFAIADHQDPKGSACVFIVESATTGFSVGEIEDLCGMRANPVASLFLEDCRVPGHNLLGRVGEGLKIGLAALDAGRIGIAAQALGIAQAAFEASARYAQQRQQFKRAIASFQSIQNYLADMATEIDAGRLLLYRACALKDSGATFGAEAAMAKLFCSSLATRVASQAVQIHGGYGYSKEYEVERYYRDAKITEIYEGTSEVQRTVISRSVLERPW